LLTLAVHHNVFFRRVAPATRLRLLTLLGLEVSGSRARSSSPRREGDAPSTKLRLSHLISPQASLLRFSSEK
jgi:hypothetical protein